MQEVQVAQMCAAHQASSCPVSPSRAHLHLPSPTSGVQSGGSRPGGGSSMAQFCKRPLAAHPNHLQTPQRHGRVVKVSWMCRITIALRLIVVIRGGS